MMWWQSSTRGRWAALGGRAPLPTETRSELDRPRGYKVAKLVAVPRADRAGFLGLTLGGLYGADAPAVCEVLAGAVPPRRRWGRRTRPADHDVPDLGCTCGFYAYKRREPAIELLAGRPPVSRLLGTALLEVDLAGTVVEFQRGFRAGGQRVLGVQVPRWCVPCAASGEARRAERLAGLDGSALDEAMRAEVPRLPPGSRLPVAVHYAGLLSRLAGRAALRPVCDHHTRSGSPPQWAGPAPTVTVELAVLAGWLGTEARWLDDRLFDVDTYVEALSWVPPVHRRVA
jgi:hypothetical protein